jgi:translation initiation factor eIF-2B subunit alpha
VERKARERILRKVQWAPRFGIPHSPNQEVKARVSPQIVERFSYILKMPRKEAIDTFNIVNSFTTLVLDHNVAVPVAAMHALVLSIQNSTATTWHGLEGQLSAAIAELKRCKHDDLGGRTNLSLGSGCDLFMKYVSRVFSLNTEAMDFEDFKKELLSRGKAFASMSEDARSRIADIGQSFLTDGCTVLIHGYSRVVNALVMKAFSEKKQFSILVTEGRPGTGGVDAAKLFHDAGIPTRLILDCAVGTFMDQVDLVLVGAEGVMENGGIVNKTGTYQIAMVAKALNKPLYVAVESYKFSRLYPLTQRDVYDLCATEDADGGELTGEGDSAVAGSLKSASVGRDRERVCTRAADDGDALEDSFAAMSMGLGEGVHSAEDDELRDALGLGSCLEDPIDAKAAGEGAKRSSAQRVVERHACALQSNNSSSIMYFDQQATAAKSAVNTHGRPDQSEQRQDQLPFSHLLIDFTPAEFITLLFTDLGVLTPAAVSDELIRLYQ